MEGKIVLMDTGEIRATLTITMSLSQWKEVAEQLPNRYPSTQFYYLVMDLIRKITKQVEAETPFEGSR